MEKIEKLHNRFDFNNLTYHYKGPTTNVDFNNFVDAATHFDEKISNRIKLDDAQKNQKEFISKLSNIEIGGKRSNKQTMK